MEMFVVVMLIGLAVFLAWRVYQYQQRRRIEDMATQAQASISADLVEVLQQFKCLQQQGVFDPHTAKQFETLIRQLTDQLFCDRDSSDSVREYLSQTRQQIAILKHKLAQYAQQPGRSRSVNDADFDALK